jgi:hypothetical protein
MNDSIAVGAPAAARARSVRGAVRGVLAAVAVVTAWSAAAPLLDVPSPVASAQAQKKEKPPQLSPEVFKALKPAQEALQKSEFDAALPLAQQGLAASKTPYDQEMSLRLLMAAHGGKKDFAGYASTVEQLLALNPASLTAEERGRFYKQLSQIHFQAKDYAKVQQYAGLWAESGGGAEAYEILAAS